MHVKNIESKTFVVSWVYYQNIHTIKNSSNQLKALAESQSQTSLMKYQRY